MCRSLLMNRLASLTCKGSDVPTQQTHMPAAASAGVWGVLRNANVALMLLVFVLHVWIGSEQALRIALAAQLLVFLARWAVKHASRCEWPDACSVNGHA